MEKKISYIAIPNNLLYHDDLHPKSKYLYCILKKHSVNDNVIINKEKLLNSLKWNDNRTLLKYLSQLMDYGFIKYEFNRLDYNKPLDIKLMFTTPFIQIERMLFDDIINKIEYERAILFAYVVEDNHNINWGYSCPTVRDIQSVLKMSNKDLNAMVKSMHNYKLCEFCAGMRIDGNKVRLRNRYLLNNIEYNKYSDRHGKKRYSHHKSKSYFFPE